MKAVSRPADHRGAVVLRLRDFHRDDGGQISFLLIFGAVLLVSLLGLVINTGDQASQKVQMQNSVDAAALSGGAWLARGMNVTSGFNLIQTQLASGAILLNGLDNALPWIHRWVGIQIGIFAKCSWTGVCFAALKVALVQYWALGKIRPFVSRLARKLAKCPSGLFWTVAKGLEHVNRFVHLSFYFIAANEVLAVGQQNGAQFALLVPGPVFHGRFKLTLPTRREDFREHCDPMVHGSPRRDSRGYEPLVGYPRRQGPFTVGRKRLETFVFFVGGVPPFSFVSEWIFNRSAKRELANVCGGRCGNGRPSPYLLDARDDGLSYLAVARKPNRKLFFRGPWLDDPPDFYTYAQIELYNGVNGDRPDAYTQDWRVRLAPASLIEEPARALGGATGIDGLADFAGTYLGIDASDLWQVGNH